MQGQAEYDYKDFNRSTQQTLDEQLLVKFFYKSKADNAATATEGRPMFKEVEYVEIRVAGSRDAQACRPATFDDKNRFPRHYEAFQRRIEMPTEGTPLAEWPQIGRSQIEELGFLNCKTVEQLRDMSDTNVGQMRGGNMLKQQAKAWLESAGETKLLAEKVELRAEIDELKEMVAALTASQKPSLATLVEEEKEPVKILKKAKKK